MWGMFKKSNFNKNIDNWDVKSVIEIYMAFDKSKINPMWNIEDYEERQSVNQMIKLDKKIPTKKKMKKIKI